MTILTEEEVERYIGLNVSSLEKIEGISRNSLKKLKSIEEEVSDQDSGSHGLPFYVAHAHHPGGESMLYLSQELELGENVLRKLFSYFEIPTLTKSESSTRPRKEHVGNLEEEGIGNLEEEHMRNLEGEK